MTAYAAPAGAAVAETRNLGKRYGDFVAVQGLSLSIQRGEIFGFLGPNGAGKTTTLKMLMGLLRPSEGEALIFGAPMAGDPFAAKRRVGVMFEQQAFYEEMTGWETLQFFARLYRVENGTKRARELMERLNLWRFRNVVTGSYSTGMQRKLSFARAILHRPELLILDEPVSGLDPFGIKQLRDILLEENAAGVTVLISSHILSELERTVHRVAIMARGTLVAQETMESLRRSVQPTRSLHVEVLDHAQAAAEAVLLLPGVLGVQVDGRYLRIQMPADVDCRADVSRALTGTGAVILAMNTVEPTLEDAFIQLTEAYVESLAGRGLAAAGGG